MFLLSPLTSFAESPDFTAIERYRFHCGCEHTQREGLRPWWLTDFCQLVTGSPCSSSLQILMSFSVLSIQAPRNLKLLISSSSVPFCCCGFDGPSFVQYCWSMAMNFVLPAFILRPTFPSYFSTLSSGSWVWSIYSDRRQVMSPRLVSKV